MDELNKEYTLLFNGVTDTIQQLELIAQRLKKLQARAEEAYLDESDAEQDGPADPPGQDVAAAEEQP